MPAVDQAPHPVLLVLALVAGLVFAWYANRWFVREWMAYRVRCLMNAPPEDIETTKQQLNTLLAIDGPDMAPHVRDAAKAWLAERDS